MTDNEELIQRVDGLAAYFVANQDRFKRFLDQLRATLESHPLLQPLVHSMKWRVKDADHLRDKLLRKAAVAGDAFDITNENLSEKITDLVGFRILHLYTRQMRELNNALQEILGEARLNIVGGPTAITWDDESRAYFKEIGIPTRDSTTLYTSVHYLVLSNSRTKLIAEIQVRTLAEELWGEVDHTLNYPHACDVLACREQIAVLARVTSSCTRLVDSIFKTHAEAHRSRT